MTIIILARVWQQTKKLKNASLYPFFLWMFLSSITEMSLCTKLNFSPQCLVHLRLFNQHKDAVWICYSLYAEKRATLELSGTWAVINFLHCQRTVQANCGEQLFISSNTDERLLSCGNSASNLPEKKSPSHSSVIKQDGWEHAKTLRETFIKL